MGISAKPLPHSYPNRQQGHWDTYIPDPISYCLRAVFFWGVYAAAAAAAKLLQSCPTLCDPVDGSPPGSPIPGILQARTLEWVAISFSNA